MIEHPKMAAFNVALDALFHEVDETLEERWGELYPVNPVRPQRGETHNPGMDGLFEVSPRFTIGIGSKQGRGYLVELRVATLEKIPEAKRKAFLETAAELIRERLPRFFPGRHLELVRDGNRYKIIGDFSLGMA
jgi:hypothetical protein